MGCRRSYYPVRRADALTVLSPGDRDNAFVLKPNVKIYGGFAGINETLLTQRNVSRITNNTILSGDIGVINNNSDNAYHVVIFDGALGAAELNGFSITGGNANGTGTVRVNSGFDLNRRIAGGIFFNRSSGVIMNVTISGNTAYSGGGIYNFYSSPAIRSTIISENSASNKGGGIYNDYHA